MAVSQSQRPFDLVVLDLDGTILDLYHHQPVSQIVRETIQAVQDAGIPVTIATGRTFDYVRQHIAHLGITTPVVTTQGAVIGDPVTGRASAETNIPLPLAREATAWIDVRTNVAALYFLDREGRTQIYQHNVGPEEDFYDHVFGKPRSMQNRLSDLLAEDDTHPPLKFLIVDETANDGALEFELRRRFSPDLYITRTHPRLVEGTAQGIDKGEGVLRLCEMMEIAPGRVLAMGDSDNDIPMLEIAGFAVAMGNSSPGVNAVADWHAPPVEEDGAAAALKMLVLDRLGATR